MAKLIENEADAYVALQCAECDGTEDEIVAAREAFIVARDALRAADA